MTKTPKKYVLYSLPRMVTGIFALSITSFLVLLMLSFKQLLLYHSTKLFMRRLYSLIVIVNDGSHYCGSSESFWRWQFPEFQQKSEVLSVNGNGANTLPWDAPVLLITSSDTQSSYWTNWPPSEGVCGPPHSVDVRLDGIESTWDSHCAALPLQVRVCSVH